MSQLDLSQDGKHRQRQTEYMRWRKLTVSSHSSCGLLFGAAERAAQFARVQCVPPGRFAGISLAIALFVALAPTNSVSSANESDGTRATMQVIFENLQELLALSASTERLREPAASRSLMAASREIEDQADLLAQHIGPAPDGSFLASTLSQSAFRVGRYFELGEFRAVQSVIAQMTDICVACHTRTSTTGDSPLAAQFINSTPVQSLSAGDFARLQIATRRFDDAMSSFELMFDDPYLSDDQILQATKTYLVVALRVTQNIPRALQALDKLSQTARATLEKRLTIWQQTLSSELDSPTEQSLQAATQLFEQAEHLETLEAGAGLVNYVVASTILGDLVAQQSLAPDALSAAYYLLGTIEYRVNHSTWIPQAELFLESAILNMPGSPVAQKAYQALHEKVSETYLALGESTLPADVESHLSALQEMAFGI